MTSHAARCTHPPRLSFPNVILYIPLVLDTDLEVPLTGYAPSFSFFPFFFLSLVFVWVWLFSQPISYFIIPALILCYFTVVLILLFLCLCIAVRTDCIGMGSTACFGHDGVTGIWDTGIWDLRVFILFFVFFSSSALECIPIIHRACSAPSISILQPLMCT